MAKCLYCGKKIKDPAPEEESALLCCSDECLGKARKYLEQSQKTKMASAVLVVAAIALVVMGSLTIFKISAGGLFLLGGTLIVFPFGSPEMLQKLSISGTRKASMILGAVIALSGVLFLIFY